MQRIVICDPNDASREFLRAMLLGIDFAFLDAECKRYDAFYDILADGSPPDLAIVNLDGDREKSLQLVNQITAHFGEVPQVVISRNHGSILEALQAGAKQFLTDPFTLEDLLRCLRKVLSDLGSAPSNGSGPIPRMTSSSQVIAVLGAHGGVGSTTLAVNLGCDIAADPDNATALIDLDLALGDAGVHLAISPHYTLADLAQNIDKLDLNFLKRSMVRHEATNLSVLDRPVQISDLDVIQGAHVERVLNLLKLSYSHLILDCSKRFTAVDVAALAAADIVLLVTQLELSSVLNATRVLAALSNIDGVGARIRVILTKAGAEEADEERHRISPLKAEEIIGKPFHWQVPFDPRSVNGARSEGVPLLKYAPRSRAGQAIQGLAASLTNKMQTIAPAPTATGGFLRGLFKSKV